MSSTDATLPSAELSIIIVNWNTRELLRRCLSSLSATTQMLPHEGIVVDNGSHDGSSSMVREQFPTATLMSNLENRGFAAAVNQALAQATGEFLLLLNSDTQVQPEAVETMVRYLREHPRIGICGCRLRDAQGRVQHSFGYGPTVWHEAIRKFVWNPWTRSAWGSRWLEQRYRRPTMVDWVLGACLMIRRKTATQIGPLDERFFFYFEEVDWCRRARETGWAVVYLPTAEVLHLGGQSVVHDPTRMAQEYRKSQRRYYQKHEARWQQWLLDRYLALRGLASNG